MDNKVKQAEKEVLKNKVDIVRLMESLGVTLAKKGRSRMGHCPFHEDKTPSLSVNQEKGLYKCFGCGEGGDVFTFVMQKLGLGFSKAVSYLEEFVAIGAPGTSATQAPARELPVQRLPAQGPITSKVSLIDVLSSYRKELEASREAIDYLRGRGLYQGQILRRLDAGYASGSLLEKCSQGQKAALKDMKIISRKGREAFKGCITIALRDLGGQVVALYGRRITNRAPKHIYMAGPHQGLLNPAGYLAYQERMIWTEGIIDAISLMVLGFAGVDALYGANGLSQMHTQALKEGRTKEIILALDNDEAGRAGVSKLREQLKEQRLIIRVIFPPEPHKDWNDFLLLEGSNQDKKRAIEGLIEAASPTYPPPVRLKISKKNGRYVASSQEVDYAIIGVKEGFVSSLKVNIRATNNKIDEEIRMATKEVVNRGRFIDNVDLFSARSRSLFATQLASSLQIESARVEEDLIDILEHLEKMRETQSSNSSEPRPLSVQEIDAAMSLLKDPKLFERIEEDLEALGYVGESVNKRLMYIAASSRKMESPISLIVHSQSASGKSYLIDTVKKLMPPKEVLSLTSLSDQALNYMADDALMGKLLVLGESVHSEAVEHQLREMLSSGELSRLVTAKNEKSGQLTSKIVRKKVKVAMVMSSTSEYINEENASRCFLIGTDESQKQTKAIHKRQRQKYSLDAYRKQREAIPAIIERHQTAQRLLEPKLIINPFAEVLDFPSKQMRTRRDHERFIDLIAAVCFLRQHQKPPAAAPHIECDMEDYRVAYKIMSAILPSTLGTLPSSALRVYEPLKALIETRSSKLNIKEDKLWITQRELREYSGLGHDQIKKNLRTLAEWEYVRVRGSSRGMRLRYGLSSRLISHSSEALPSPQVILERLKSGAKMKKELIPFYAKNKKKVGPSGAKIRATG